MEDVQVADGKAESTTRVRVRRVDDVKSLQELLPHIKHNLKLMSYVMHRMTDPDTLILHIGEKACIVTSIIEHDFFGGKVALVAWGQNPEKLPLEYVRKALWTSDTWSKDRGAHMAIAMMDEHSPYKRIKAFERLTGLQVFRLLFAKELSG